MHGGDNIEQMCEDLMSTETMPLTASVKMIQNIVRIACDSCSASAPMRDPLDTTTSEREILEKALASADSVTTVGDQVALLEDFKLKIQETNNAVVAVTDEVFTKWTSVYSTYQVIWKRLKSFVASRLTVTIDKPEQTLTKLQKNLVHVLLQASNFVLFLETEETQTAYGNKVNSLSDLKARLQQVVCAARQLLPEFTDADVQKFVGDHVISSLQIPPVAEALRRTVCALALERMATVLRDIDLDK